MFKSKWKNLLTPVLSLAFNQSFDMNSILNCFLFFTLIFCLQEWNKNKKDWNQLKIRFDHFAKVMMHDIKKKMQVNENDKHNMDLTANLWL